MSEPSNVFQSNKKHSKTGSLSFLTTQVAQWQKLTKIIQPVLPKNSQWQVVCYQHGILTITGDNQAMISQLNYLQSQYVTQLTQTAEFKELKKIRAYLRTKNEPKTPTPSPISESISDETRDMLRSAADFVSDPKLSQALLRLASNKR